MSIDPWPRAGGSRKSIVGLGLLLIMLALAAMGCSDDPGGPDEDAAASVTPTASVGSSPKPKPTIQRDLEGTYTTVIARHEFEDFEPETYPPDVFAGFYELVIDGSEYRLENVGFGRITGRVAIEGSELRFENLPAPRGAFNCFDESGMRGRTRAEGTGTYTYEVNRFAVELVSEEEPCDLRGFLMERTWDLQSS